MMFVYHYVIIPFHPQYLPRHAHCKVEGAEVEGAVFQNYQVFSTCAISYFLFLVQKYGFLYPDSFELVFEHMTSTQTPHITSTQVS